MSAAEGVRKMLTLADEGGREGLVYADNTLKKCFKIGKNIGLYIIYEALQDTVYI